MSKLYNKLKQNNKQNLDHEKDNIIWFGDLNFRVDQNILSNLYSDSKKSKKSIKNKYLNLMHSMINTQTNQSTLKRGFKKSLNKPCFFKTPALVAKILFGQMGEELILSGQRVCPFKLNECGFNFNYYNLDLAFQNIFSQ